MAKIKTGAAMGIGAGIAAAAIGAALGAYLFTGDRAVKTKKVLKGWILKAKGEILEQLEGLKDVSEETYDKVVDQVAKKYSQMAGISKAEVEELAADLKKHWKVVSKEIAAKAKKITE